jgi:ferredoxin-NADP reductase
VLRRNRAANRHYALTFFCGPAAMAEDVRAVCAKIHIPFQQENF